MAPLRLILLTAAFLMAGAEPAQACRCPQAPLERYFERAEIVVVGRVTAVKAADAEGGARFEVSIAPQFRPEPTFKGSLDEMVLATPQSSAADVAQPQLARFDTCSGSRRYLSNDPREGPAFIGIENRRVLPRLFELEQAARQAPSSQTGETFHTSPECWSEPRIYHAGRAPLDVGDRIRITWEPGRRPASSVTSPRALCVASVPDASNTMPLSGPSADP